MVVLSNPVRIKFEEDEGEPRGQTFSHHVRKNHIGIVLLFRIFILKELPETRIHRLCTTAVSEETFQCHSKIGRTSLIH